jgi:hypothetical protein
VARLRFFAAFALFLIGLLVLGSGWRLPGPPRINVRWTAPMTADARAAAERELRLTEPVHLSDRTWSYVLRDTSRDHVGQILDHPSVEDRHYIGAGRTLEPDAPPLPAWFMARYGRPPVSWLAASWWIAGPLLCALGLLAGRPQLLAWGRTADLRLAGILVVSAVVRIVLILQGGQFYWPDEKRYRGAHVLLSALRGDRAAWHEVLAEPTALLLKIVGLLPAWVEELTGDNPHVPALFFGTCSLVCIWLTAAIARRLGATRDESFLAASLAAGSTALLYMSRHLTGYDLALMCGLFAVFAGVRRPGSRLGSVLTGLWAVAAFLAYAGAWPLAAAACAIHVTDAPNRRDAVRRAVLAGAGMALAAGVMMLGYAAAGSSWLQQLRAFAGLITQGEFSEGWSLPFAYLWSAEHLLLIGWLVAAAWCVWRLRWALQARLTRAGLVGALCVYASLAVSSTLLHRFVVYGRLVRPLVPFLCLLTAGVLGLLVSRAGARRSVIVALAVVAVTAQAAVNFIAPLRIVYPAEFIARIEREQPAPHIFVNARHLYPGPEAVAIPPGSREIASAPHPLAFRPYQYEGYTRAERQALQVLDLRMRAFIPPR